MNAKQLLSVAVLLGLLASGLPARAADIAPDLAEARPAGRQVILTAFTRARAAMDLAAENPGKVLAVAGEVGQAIGRDGTFARLDATLAALELEKNRAEQARLASLAAYLDKEAGRYRTLVAKSVADPASLDRLEQDLDAARHQLAALRVEERRLAEVVSRSTVKAPPGWRIMRRDVEPGQWVAAGQVLGRAGDYSVLLAPLALAPEELAALRRAGKDLRAELPDLGLTVPAAVYRTSPAFDPETRKTDLDLALDGDIPERRGGLRVRLALTIPDEAGAVLLPEAALHRRYDEHFLVREDGGRVPVVLLDRTADGLVRVANHGLRPGDRFRLGAGN
ncbi:MAG: efflux RND transporter periplasmic adaptor subunit [Thermodesulfobacteriota bacterium]